MPRRYGPRTGPRARVPVRLDPKLLATLTAFAEASGRSLNAEILDRLTWSLRCTCRPRAVMIFSAPVAMPETPVLVRMVDPPATDPARAVEPDLPVFDLEPDDDAAE